MLGAASATKYSITVEAHAVRTANAELKAQHDRGVEIQERLKVCRVAVDDLWTSMRLGERKVLVVQGLMDEAEVESSRCEGETERCNQELQIDDERMEMTDEQRRVSNFNLLQFGVARGLREVLLFSRSVYLGGRVQFEQNMVRCG